MSDSLPLARRLSALDDETLTAILVRRQVAPRELRDFFDLADALLDPASIRLALRTLDRATLTALSAPDAAATVSASVTEALLGLALGEPTPDAPPGLRPYGAVTEAATAVLGASDPAAVDGVSTDTARVDAASAEPDGAGRTRSDREAGRRARDPARDALAGERAFVAMSAVAELGMQLRTTPARLLARGGLPAGEEKRLAALLGVESGRVADLIEVATAAHLVTVDVGTLLSTTGTDAWSLLPSAERWLALATAWHDGLPAPTRRSLDASAGEWMSGTALRDRYLHVFPASDEAMRAELRHVDAIAELLGLTVDGHGTAFGHAALAAPTAVGALGAATEASDTRGNATVPAPGIRAILPTAVTTTAVDAGGTSTTEGVATDAPTAVGVTPDDLTADDATAGAAAGTAPADLAAIAAALPAEVERVYLQHDLSVIAPGPLVPAVDARLRLLADLEYRGVASTYRISQATIDRALASGETEPGLRAFLAEISLTGLPQAVDYLLTEGARRHGLVRVRRLIDDDRKPGAARTLVRTTDHRLLAAIAVDKTLAPLALHRIAPAPASAPAAAATETAAPADALASRSDAATVYWLLVDARYPVLAEDAEGHQIVMRRGRVAEPPPSASPPAPPSGVADLVRRLRDASARQAPADDSAWVTRQLDKAVRARTPVSIEVLLPDGSSVCLEVTPLSLANGRLRCVDERAGVERTVPVANIRLIQAD